MKYKSTELKMPFSGKLKMSPFVHPLPLLVGCHQGSKSGGRGREQGFNEVAFWCLIN